MIFADKYPSHLDYKADLMKKAVLSAVSTIGSSGRVIYVSEHGYDGNDGLTPKTAIRSTLRLNGMRFEYGDSVLFERGGVYRGHICARSGVTYSAYGEGAKPIINGSFKNYADPALWEKTDFENVWRCTEPLNNVGIVALDHTPVPGKYDDLCGVKRIPTLDGFENEKDLKADGEFFSNLRNDDLFLYCSAGNPGDVYASIELGTCYNLITVDARSHDIVFDNLDIRYTGAHGLRVYPDCKDITIQNCIFCYLGGSILRGFIGGENVRYGNAVELWMSNDGITVKNNWMYQIYDTGITHQFTPVGYSRSQMRNIRYEDNLIEYCFWSLEYYNPRVEGGTMKSENIHIARNFCRMGGYGWGCPGRETQAPMFSAGSCPDDTRDYLVENNIFDRCLGYLIRESDYPGNHKTVFSRNTYIQPEGKPFAWLFGETYCMDEQAEETLKTVNGDIDPVVIALRED